MGLERTERPFQKDKDGLLRMREVVSVNFSFSPEETPNSSSLSEAIVLTSGQPLPRGATNATARPYCTSPTTGPPAADLLAR
jgi:hypothetical protein